MFCRKLRKLLPLAAGCFWAGAAPFSFLSSQAARSRQCRIACHASDGDDSKLSPDVPWWQLEDEAERLMAPRMPFRVEQVSPPPVKKLGYALLDARTGRGDVINMKGAEKDDYVVSKALLFLSIGGTAAAT
ncbi:unnamed protein product [Symbiodinium natans]|uniref:Uncharacterized protein n=1 Tax=Symbiodinium natans TaxID=878477 RepID=A0A812UPY1_9DINO|nr:unnamed protein product [Symbiodinium natans]